MSRYCSQAQRMQLSPQIWSKACLITATWRPQHLVSCAQNKQILKIGDRSIHSEANRDVFMTLTAMVIEMFGSKSGDTIFPIGRVLCKTCHSSVQSIPKLEKKLLDLNQQIREQLRHAGLPYGLTRLPRQERQSVEAPTCTTPPADSSKGTFRFP